MVMMRTVTALLLAAMLETGCASFGCVSCTEPYVGPAVELSVREEVLGSSFGVDRVNKLVHVDNPYDGNVRIYLDCGSSEWDFVVGARRSQKLFLTVPATAAGREACAVRSWSFSADPPTYGPGAR